MIPITKSATADTRTCDFANTTKETLLASSRTHIGDVVKAMAFFIGKLTEAAGEHDYDKLTAIEWFHEDFVTDFKQTGWWDNHRKIHRHHLAQEDGVPEDVNLLDVLEYISDCVMAGMAAVHADNTSRMLADRGGDMPKCKPKLGTHFCERCGRDATTNDARSSACPSIPTDRRWRMTYPPHSSPNDKAQATESAISKPRILKLIPQRALVACCRLFSVRAALGCLKG